MTARHLLPRATSWASRKPRRQDGDPRSSRPSRLPYAPTARPGWLHLPEAVRAEIDRRSLQPTSSALSARAGDTTGFAALLTHHDDSQSFCKAAPAASPAGIAYAREAAIVALLPTGVPAARLRWRAAITAEERAGRADGWFVAAYDAAGPASFEPGWSSAPGKALDAVTATATALTHASPALRSAAQPPGPLPACWADIAARRRSLPAQAAHLHRFAPTMAALEAAFLTAAAETDRLAHFAVRADNLVQGGGRVRLVSWAAMRPAPADVDLVMLAVAAGADGADPQHVFDQGDVAMSGAALDQALAWLCGSWLTDPSGRAGGRLRDGLIAWQWLADRHQLPYAPALRVRRSPR